MAFVLLDLVADVFVKQQLAEDEGAHGLHIQTLRFSQDLLVGSVDGSTLLLLLKEDITVFYITALFEVFYQTFSAPSTCQRAADHTGMSALRYPPLQYRVITITHVKEDLDPNDLK